MTPKSLVAILRQNRYNTYYVEIFDRNITSKIGVILRRNFLVVVALILVQMACHKC